MAKKALLVGINRYKIPGADLRGCVNDVKNLRAVLTTYCGFAGKDIKTLTDYAATTKAMRDAIATLVKGAKKGDVLLFHYSGHGANVPDKNGDEADRRDEILCPTDLDWKDPLLDDWLRTTFDRLPAGVSFTVVMDCCHSGYQHTSHLAPGRAGHPPLPPQPVGSDGDGIRAEARGKVKGSLRRSTPARRKTDIVAVNIPEVLVTGCRDTQTSADAEIGGSFNGALTYHLVATIKAARGKLTYRELHDGTVKRLKKGGFSQVPQLEGRAPSFDRSFLSPLV